MKLGHKRRQEGEPAGIDKLDVQPSKHITARAFRLRASCASGCGHVLEHERPVHMCPYLRPSAPSLLRWLVSRVSRETSEAAICL